MVVCTVVLLFGPPLPESALLGGLSRPLLLAQSSPPNSGRQSGKGQPDADSAPDGPSRPPRRRPRYDLGMDGKAHTSMFGVQAQGYKFVYVIDRSGSMGGSGPTALKAAKAELLASLNDLGQTHQFQIVFYNEKPALFNPTGDPHRACSPPSGTRLRPKGSSTASPPSTAPGTTRPCCWPSGCTRT